MFVTVYKTERLSLSCKPPRESLVPRCHHEQHSLTTSAQPTKSNKAPHLQQTCPSVCTNVSRAESIRSMADTAHDSETRSVVGTAHLLCVCASCVNASQLVNASQERNSGKRWNGCALRGCRENVPRNENQTSVGLPRLLSLRGARLSQAHVQQSIEVLGSRADSKCSGWIRWALWPGRAAARKLISCAYAASQCTLC